MNLKSAHHVSLRGHGAATGTHTRRAIGVVARKSELGFEVAAVVERVRVQHNERHAPLEDVLVDELQASQSRGIGRKTPRSTYLDIRPCLLAQRFELVHEQSLGGLRHDAVVARVG